MHPPALQPELIAESQVAPSQAVIVVTGATGFVGRALAAALEALDVPHELLDRRRSKAGLEGALAALPASQRQRAVLIHLAGLSDARLAEREPSQALDDIVRLTLHTVEACVRFKLAKCVLVSTALVYGRQPCQPVAEEAMLRPQGLYAGAKAAAESIALGRAAGEAIALDIVRPCNVIGPGIKAGTLVADVLAQLRRRPSRVRLQSLHVRRDYLDVRDLAQALLAVARLPASPGQVRVFNAGTGIGTSALELCRLLQRIAGLPSTDPIETGAEDLRAFDLIPDPGRLRAMTGWAPIWSLEETLIEVAHGA